MAVGFWNFTGAGIFGFLINTPIVSYFEMGTNLTPNHGHAAMMGVFGMLGVALMVFVLRETVDDARWSRLRRFILCGFWGLNIGLAMMVALSLFPSGLLQVRDVIENGYWQARSGGGGHAPCIALERPSALLLSRYKALRERVPERVMTPRACRRSWFRN